jgi:molecular chaperone GrpE
VAEDRKLKGEITGEKKEEKKPEPSAPADKTHMAASQHDKAKELEDRLMRLQADFENYKKRAVKENEAVRENASAEVILKLLPVVDDFGIAMAHIDKAANKEVWHGMELVYNKLKDALKKEGVEEMKAVGERFDPYRHDALRQGEGEEGKIAEVIQKGYTLKGKVLRHAKVVVGTGKKTEEKGKCRGGKEEN